MFVTFETYQSLLPSQRFSYCVLLVTSMAQALDIQTQCAHIGLSIDSGL